MCLPAAKGMSEVMEQCSVKYTSKGVARAALAVVCMVLFLGGFCMDYLLIKTQLQNPIRAVRVETPASFVTSETAREIIVLCL